MTKLFNRSLITAFAWSTCFSGIKMHVEQRAIIRGYTTDRYGLFHKFGKHGYFGIKHHLLSNSLTVVSILRKDCALAFRLCVMMLVAVTSLQPATAQITPSTPIWYRPGPGTGTWHYRVKLDLPPSIVRGHTVVVNMDFIDLLNKLGVNTSSVSFNPSSIVIHHYPVPGNINQIGNREYNDFRYNDADDPIGNGRGEIRFIAPSRSANDQFYIYFDILENGPKTISPTPINGNFEVTSANPIPRGWLRTFQSIGADLQQVTGGTVSVTDTITANGGSNETRSVNSDPFTGDRSLLLGHRSGAEPGIPGTLGSGLNKLITVPFTNPGNLTFRYKIEGWDTSVNGPPLPNFGDYFRVFLQNGSGPQVEVFGPNQTNYNSFPFSPNFGPGDATILVSGRGHYNGYDTNLQNIHTNGGSIPTGTEQWITVNIDLTPFRGTSPILNFEFINRQGFKSWVQIDDVEWSVVNLPQSGIQFPEAFQVALLTPAQPLTLVAGDMIPAPIRAESDITPITQSGRLTVDLVDQFNNIRSTSFLFDDGSHGDSVAGDRVWTNDGSQGSEPLPTVPADVTGTSDWSLRVYAKDNSVSGLNNLFDGFLTTNNQVGSFGNRFYNADDLSILVGAPDIRVTKTSIAIDDHINSTNFKSIPDAVVEYCLTIENQGLDATNIEAVDNIDTSLITYVAGSIRSGPDCRDASTVGIGIVEDDDDVDGDFGDLADGVTASYDASSGQITVKRGNLLNSGSFAVIFHVTIN